MIAATGNSAESRATFVPVDGMRPVVQAEHIRAPVGANVATTVEPVEVVNHRVEQKSSTGIVVHRMKRLPCLSEGLNVTITLRLDLPGAMEGTGMAALIFKSTAHAQVGLPILVSEKAMSVSGQTDSKNKFGSNRAVDVVSQGDLIHLQVPLHIKAAQEYRLYGPSLGRRLFLLMVAYALSGAVAYTFPQVIVWNRAALLITGISYLVGISSLWSP